MKVVISPTYTKVSEISTSQVNTLYRLFGVKTENYWFKQAYRQRRWDGRERFFNKKTRTFPTGLMKQFLKIVKSQKWKFDPENSHILQTTDIPLKVPKGLVLRPYQKKAAKRCLKNKRGILSLATNSGKTIIAVAVINSLLPRKVIIVVERLDLVHQTAKVMKKFVKGATVGMVGGGKREVDADIVVATVQTLIRLMKDRPSLKKRWDVMFLDEAHHASSDTWYKTIMEIKAEFRFALSGTPFDHVKEKDLRIVGATGPVLIKVTNQFLIEHGYSAVPTVYFSKIKNSKIVVSGHWHSVYSEGIDQNLERNKAIIRLSTKLSNEGFKVLLLVVHIDHARFLYEQLRQKNDHVFLNFGGTSGYIRAKTKEDFQEAESGAILVASTIYDEGVDIPEVNCLIMAGGQKKPRKILQRVGRSLRAKVGDNRTRIYDFFDLEHRFLAKHSFQRLSVYKAEGFTVKGLTQEARDLIDEHDRVKTVSRKRKNVAPPNRPSTRRRRKPLPILPTFRR